MSCERSCSSCRRVSSFNSKVTQFERDRLNIFRVRVLTSSGSTGGRGGGVDAADAADAEAMLKP